MQPGLRDDDDVCHVVLVEDLASLLPDIVTVEVAAIGMQLDGVVGHHQEELLEAFGDLPLADDDGVRTVIRVAVLLIRLFRRSSQRKVARVGLLSLLTETERICDDAVFHSFAGIDTSHIITFSRFSRRSPDYLPIRYRSVSS